MNVGLTSLIDRASAGHIEASRAFHAAIQAAGGQQGPTNLAELQQARRSLPDRPAAGRTVVEHLARAGTRQVPVRLTSPSTGASRATYPDVSPPYGDLRGLPPTLLLVGTLDMLLEDNFVLAARLSAAGNEVDLRVYPDSMHGSPRTRFPWQQPLSMRLRPGWPADWASGSASRDRRRRRGRRGRRPPTVCATNREACPRGTNSTGAPP
jgi:acetyl esterase/lipase